VNDARDVVTDGDIEIVSERHWICWDTRVASGQSPLLVSVSVFCLSVCLCLPLSVYVCLSLSASVCSSVCSFVCGRVSLTELTMGDRISIWFKNCIRNDGCFAAELAKQSLRLEFDASLVDRLSSEASIAFVMWLDSYCL